MKTLLFSSLLCVSMAANSYGQFTFTAKPGVSTNGATFGYKFNNTFAGELILSGGFDYIHASGTYEINGENLELLYSNNSYSYRIVPFSSTSELSLNIYAPNINAKVLFDCAEKVSAYVTGSISKPFVCGESSNNGHDSKLEEYLSNLSVWGFQLGVGSEYYFSDNFSVGGEFGLRIFIADYDQNNTNQQMALEGNINNPQYKMVDVNTNYLLSMGYSFTYTVVSLNFYF